MYSKYQLYCYINDDMRGEVSDLTASAGFYFLVFMHVVYIRLGMLGISARQVLGMSCEC